MPAFKTYLAALVCCGAPLLAQSFPDAARLLQGQGEIFKTANTLQYTQQMDMEMNLMGNATKISITMLAQYANPGKFRMEAKSMGVASSTIVFDGETTWMYMPMLKQYSRQKGTMPGQDLMEQFTAMAGNEQVMSSAKVLRAEVLEIDGQPYDCWVVEAKPGKLSLPGTTGAQVSDSVNTLWIDKQIGIARRTVITGKVQGLPGGESVTKNTTTLHDVQLNLLLPDSLFQFTPPEGTKESPDLLAATTARLLDKPAQGVRAGAQGPVQRPAKAQAFTPQAFVPVLHPTTHVEPKYPDAAKSAKARGMVEILATIDPAGAVVDTEILSGNELLRQAAVDAAKQWKFRPVLRDSRAVFAYTSLYIDVSDPNEKADASLASLVDGGLDDAPDMSRIFELMRTMPRTPQQELADLEQDLGPATGPDRDWILPQLAKAAVAAGALDKAYSYAGEMLKADPKNPNYGQSFHDGHAIQGLVALRQGNVTLATQDLLEAGRTPGAPLLNSLGPNVRLAKELLEKGEKDAVLEYLSRCKSFWKSGADTLDAWSRAIRSGNLPDFGLNGAI